MKSEAKDDTLILFIEKEDITNSGTDAANITYQVGSIPADIMNQIKSGDFSKIQVSLSLVGDDSQFYDIGAFVFD